MKSTRDFPLGPAMPPQDYCTVCGGHEGLRDLYAVEKKLYPDYHGQTVSFHHTPSKSLYGGKHDSGVRVCGSGTTGCHGDAEAKRIDFKPAGDRWAFRINDKSLAERITRRNNKLGWEWPLGNIERGVWYSCQ